MGTPIDAPRSHLRVAVDGRLDNRRELVDVLGGSSRELSDRELLVAGYERWGTGLTERLAGEFAFVIWDEARRQIYAARDALGVRPLFYHHDARRVAFASNVEQLLALGDFEPKLEERSIFDYLLDEPRFAPETFFKGIHRLLPGHWLLATEDSIRQERYWRPHSRPALQVDCHGEFRRLFEQAVEARLDSERPLLAQLSGGLDSSAIVCVADAIYARNGVKRPPLTTASAVFPGLDCDETPYIDAVERQVRFPSEHWDATTEVPWDGTPRATADPWSAGPEADQLFDLARRRGSQVILSGFGGDELLFERGIFRDLATSGRWLRLLRESALAPRYSTQSSWYFLQDGLRALVPEFARSRYRRFRLTHRGRPPAWLGPRLREFWPPADDKDSQPEFASRTQQMTWQRLTSGQMLLALETQCHQATRYGVEMRYPFLDVRLADFVLSLPFMCRLPTGEMKALLRRSVGELLPKEIARRRRVTTFDVNIRLHLERILPRVGEILSGNSWTALGFLNRDDVQKDVNMIDKGNLYRLTLDRLMQLWNFARLELWLRSVAEKYSTSF
jgi:asparagine synthase (glutamine-hydrolysing)